MGLSHKPIVYSPIDTTCRNNCLSQCSTGYRHNPIHVHKKGSELDTKHTRSNDTTCRQQRLPAIYPAYNPQTLRVGIKGSQPFSSWPGRPQFWLLEAAAAGPHMSVPTLSLPAVLLTSMFIPCSYLRCMAACPYLSPPVVLGFISLPVPTCDWATAGHTIIPDKSGPQPKLPHGKHTGPA